MTSEQYRGYILLTCSESTVSLAFDENATRSKPKNETPQETGTYAHFYANQEKETLKCFLPHIMTVFDRPGVVECLMQQADAVNCKKKVTP